ncbi:MAG: L-seryl-tRNA(Sec) selenium transferase [Firmicutes bacterium]|nr:L-seryl-tRNA(Sec) selenium transferase [Bacillota bacterium]
MSENSKEQLRNLPKVDQVLSRPEFSVAMEDHPRETVVEAVRAAIADMRNAILEGKSINVTEDTAVNIALYKLEQSEVRSLRRVINGTGILLHTNLGRARLPKSVAEAVSSIASGYSTLEYDVQKGARGSRHDHVNKLISKVTGAEDAIAINNNAADTLIVLMALAHEKEVVVSRGELVEIGGAFRVPDIMKVGGTVLREVGTTNKTHLYDYERAICEETAAIMKVHTSNYRILGFTEDVPAAELAMLAHDNGLPFIYDLGSGLIVDLQSYGLDEPTVASAFKAGADLALFSGDKLLGGPQAGIIAGKKEYIDIIKKHPLARAMRLDKMTLCALEETFRLYEDLDQAKKEIPVLSMITRPAAEIKNKAAIFGSKLRNVGIAADISIMQGIGRVGGGSAPMLDLETWAVAIVPKNMSVDKLGESLRNWVVPIISHVQNDCLLLDMRTIADDELDVTAKALIDILV